MDFAHDNPNSELRVGVSAPPPLQGDPPAEEGSRDAPVSEDEGSRHPGWLDRLGRAAGITAIGAGAIALGSMLSGGNNEPPMMNGADLLTSLWQVPAGQRALRERIQTREQWEQIAARTWTIPAVRDWLQTTPAGRRALTRIDL